MKKQLGYLLRGVEFIKTELLLEIEQMQEEYNTIAIGVYSDELFEEVYGRPPIKTYEERAHLANCIKGVDFVFKVKEANGEVHKEPPLYEDDGSPKVYHVAFAPGTYDLLHEGHLDHLIQCRKLSDILVVGVKSDDHVYETKKKIPRQDEETRMRVIENLKFVDHVILVPTRDKRWANNVVKKITGYPIDVVILGSDCKGQEEMQNPDGLCFIFTFRDPSVQEKRSSTYYRKEYEKIHKKSDE